MKALNLLFALSISYSLLIAKQTPTSLLDNYKQAIRDYNKAPNNYSNAFKLANIAFDAGNFKQAYDVVLHILEKTPEDLDTLLLYSTILIEYGYEDKAKRKLYKIIELQPDSIYAKQAQKSLDILRRRHSSFQSKHKVIFNLGVDTNPALLLQDYDKINYITTIACTTSPQNCQFNERFSDAKGFVDSSLKGDYVYDLGDTGGFFLKMGLGASGRNYLDEIDAGYFSINMSIEPGYTTANMGSFLFLLSPGSYYSKLTPFKQNPSTNEYSQFKVKIHHYYKYPSGAQLSTGFIHREEDGHENFDMNGTYYQDYSLDHNSFYVNYKSKPSNHNFYVNLSRGFRYNDYYYYNMAPPLPFASYDEGSLTFGYELKQNSHIYKLGTGLTVRSFDDTVFLDNNVSTNEIREDHSFSLSLQVKFLTGFLSDSILGYNLVTNASNYLPMEFTKHELTLTYIFKP